MPAIHTVIAEEVQPMDDAFARFQADLAGVGKTPAGSVGQAAPPRMAGYPSGPAHGGYAPAPHQPYMPPPASAAYYPPQQQQQAYHAGQPAGGHYGQHYPYQQQHHQAAQHGQYHHQQQQQQHNQGSQKQQQGDAAADDSKNKKRKGTLREAANTRWRDATLDEWPDNDYRIFVGDLGNDVNDDALAKAFQKYPTFAMAKIVKDKRTKKTKGYGFVSFLDSNDYAQALREMNGKYIGNRPVKLRKSSWDERNAHLPPHKRQKKEGQAK